MSSMPLGASSDGPRPEAAPELRVVDVELPDDAHYNP